MRHRQKFILIAILVILDFCIFYYGRAETGFQVSFLDVGQGDSFFVESPTGVQMLIDTGKPGAVMAPLSEEISFADQSIDILLLTHTDLDHNGGAVEVLKKYSIATLILNKEYTGGDDKQIVDLARARGVKIVYARRGQVIDLGGGAYVTILFPDRDVSELESNTASIGLKVTYGEVDFILTGDMPSTVEEYLARIDEGFLDAEILKLGHHGSKTSTSDNFLKAVSPDYAIVSAGADNTYGHPNKEVINRLFGIQVLETSKASTITFVSDGEDLILK
jgi:competence protein ComEC